MKRKKISLHHLLDEGFYFMSLSRRVIQSPMSRKIVRTINKYLKEGTKRRTGIAKSGPMINESG